MLGWVKGPVADALWQSFGSSSRKSSSDTVAYSTELIDSIDDDDLELLVREGNSVAVKNRLISTQVDPDARDEAGATLLHVVAGCKGAHDFSTDAYISTARELLQHGFSLLAKDKTGRTPLHVAAERGNADLLRQFSHIAETVNIGDKQGQTPLHACTSNAGVSGRRKLSEEKLQCMAVLIEYSAILDAFDHAGFTPLHYASDNGNVRAVKMLLNNGCSMHQQGPMGHTAEHLAQEKGHSAVVQLLQKHGLKAARKKQAHYDGVERRA